MESEKGKIIIRKNKKGKLIFEVEIGAKKPMTIPNFYEIKDENKYLLKLDSKENTKDKLEELMNQVIELPSSEYRMVSNEILSLLAWMKRFVEGLVEGVDNAN